MELLERRVNFPVYLYPPDYEQPPAETEAPSTGIALYNIIRAQNPPRFSYPNLKQTGQDLEALVFKLSRTRNRRRREVPKSPL